MLHDFFPTSITIGEDVSGMPTFCRCGVLDRVAAGSAAHMPTRSLRPPQQPVAASTAPACCC